MEGPRSGSEESSFNKLCIFRKLSVTVIFSLYRNKYLHMRCLFCFRANCLVQYWRLTWNMILLHISNSFLLMQFITFSTALLVATYGGHLDTVQVYHPCEQNLQYLQKWYSPIISWIFSVLTWRLPDASGLVAALIFWMQVLWKSFASQN